MFSGIIEAVGRIAAIETLGGDCRMRFEAAGYLNDVRPGDSIAVNGVCLTAVTLDEQHFSADLSAETLGLTVAGAWVAGRRVNLEKALTPAKPLGGQAIRTSHARLITGADNATSTGSQGLIRSSTATPSSGVSISTCTCIPQVSCSRAGRPSRPTRRW